MRSSFVTVLWLAFLASLGPAANAREWTVGEGKQTFEAELVKFADGQVTLKKPAGEMVTMPERDFGEADRRFLATWKKDHEVSYTKDVQPFLTKYCLDCHKHTKAKAGYDVESYGLLMRVGKKGAMVVPGKPEASRLTLTMEKKGKPMPPRKSPQPTADEIARITAWIAAGAQDDSAGDHSPKAGDAKDKSPR